MARRADPRREALDEQVMRTLPSVAAASAAIFGASAMSIYLTWNATTRDLVTGLYVANSLANLVVLFIAMRKRIPARWANATVGMLLAAGAGFTALNLLHPASPDQVASGIIGPLAAGILLLHWRWFAFTATAHVVAALLVARSVERTSMGGLITILLAAAAVGALLHAVRLRNARRIEDLLATNEAQRAELRRALDELRASQEDSIRREKLSALGTLVAGVAHEINNPLTYMRGNAELAEMAIDDAKREGRPLSPEEIEALSRAHGAVLGGIDRIEHITSSLKKVARTTPGEPRDEDLAALCDSVLLVASSRIAPDIDVRRDYRASSPAHISSGDISQVVLNLVLNASDAMGSRGTLTLRTRDVPEGVLLEVEDTGHGVSAASKAKLFTPFFTTKPHGTGLGLSISHRIVEDHRGTLSYTDAPGGGACFRVVLPAGPPPRKVLDRDPALAAIR